MRTCFSNTSSWIRIVKISENSGADLERILGEADGTGLIGRILCVGEDTGAASISIAGIEMIIAIQRSKILR
jgi:hypothetical protein